MGGINQIRIMIVFTSKNYFEGVDVDLYKFSSIIQILLCGRKNG